MQAAIETRDLVKRFGRQAAVDGIGLCVEQGSIFAFLGPNGAGKTTTIRLLLGLLRPTSGSIRMLGLPMPDARREISRSVGALVETPCHYGHLTGTENLDVTRRLLGLNRSEIGRVMELVDLAEAAAEPVRSYSLGMRQRLGIARALLGGPRLLILDEPTNGLDPDGIRDIRSLIRALPGRGGVTIFVSSHLLAEVEQTATHVAFMWRGRLVAQGELEQVLRAGAPLLELEVEDAERAAELLSDAEVAIERGSGNRLQVRSAGAALEPASINLLLTRAGVGVSRLALRQPSLEDLYLMLTGREANSAAAGGKEHAA